MRFLASALLLAIMAGAGCAPSASRTPSAERTVQPSRLSSRESTPLPGIVRADGDEVLAVGTLVYDRGNQRFMLVNAGPTGNLTGREQVIAQIGAGQGTTEGGDLVGLVGAYIEFRGTYTESTESSVTYPSVTPDSMRIITLPGDR